jgi:hypothetical protein
MDGVRISKDASIYGFPSGTNPFHIERRTEAVKSDETRTDIVQPVSQTYGTCYTRDATKKEVEHGLVDLTA